MVVVFILVAVLVCMLCVMMHVMLPRVCACSNYTFVLAMVFLYSIMGSNLIGFSRVLGIIGAVQVLGLKRLGIRAAMLHSGEYRAFICRASLTC